MFSKSYNLGKGFYLHCWTHEENQDTKKLGNQGKVTHRLN